MPTDLLRSRLDALARKSATLQRHAADCQSLVGEVSESLRLGISFITASSAQIAEDLADLRRRIERLETARSILWITTSEPEPQIAPEWALEIEHEV